MTVQGWLRHKRRNEALLWLAFFMLQTAANIAVIGFDLGRTGLDYPMWAVSVWEISSAVMFVALIPPLLWFDSRFPLQLGRLGRNVLAHLLFTVPWSVVHVAGMVLIRKAVYLLLGRSYEFGPPSTELVYEYLKDFRVYFGLVALIYLYRFVIRRLRGEARFVADGADEPETVNPDRFLVKMLGKEFLVRVSDIDWIEAAGNYVTLHVDRKAYMLRETMSRIEERLAGCGFVRVHRSAIVNLDRIQHIEPFDTGDGRAHLLSGQTVPVSRRYRQQLREQLS